MQFSSNDLKQQNWTGVEFLKQSYLVVGGFEEQSWLKIIFIIDKYIIKHNFFEFSTFFYIFALWYWKK